MIFLLLFVLVQEMAAVQVSTKNGKLKGDYIRNQFGNNYYAFVCIPYAKSTISNFISEDPQPIGNWNGVRDATIGSLPCNCSKATNQTQDNAGWLYLNVYTKKIRRWLPPTMVRTYQVSPVEVYFEDCALNSNQTTKSEIENSFILKIDIVKVLVNHRMSTAGLSDIAVKDQILALQWIKDNILSFGGDAKKVTVFEGHSGLADLDINRLPVGTTTI